jgi:low affinity Fe/Cu permease
MDRIFTKFASVVSFLSGQPLAFVLAVSTIVVWGVTGPMFGYSDTWQLVINTGTTIVTFLMVFLIQNSTNRDAAAMQAKLDELLRAVAKARGEFIGIEHLSEQQVEEIRDALEREAGAKGGKTAGKKHGKTLDQLLRRR